MLRKTFTGIFLLCLSVFSFCQTAIEPEQKISLLFIGDIMGHDTQIWSAENRGNHTYNYDDVFQYVKPIISEASIAIANLEVTLAGPPYKGYPQFSSPAALAAACRDAGIDCLVTANNHSADRGNKGILSSIYKLDSLGIPHTGTFSDQQSRENRQPLILQKNGISLALLNYTYGTNGISVPEPVIVNKLDKELITSDIAKAKAINPDAIILFLHWGTEYDTVPSSAQTELAEYFFSKGVDLVIGSHPHVVQKMVWYRDGSANNNKAVVYSLGNFVSNQRKPKTDGGAMVRIEMTKTDQGMKIINAGYYLTWVYTPVVDYRLKFYILPCSEYEKKADSFLNPDEYSQMMRYIDYSRNLLNNQNINIREYIFNSNNWLLDN
jgi:poly-gamma-glutamate capsule biosynthesis protein CapA/YwtB (metallophosphatase superfamily)